MDKNLMLVDSHCHLDFDVFDGDRTEAVARAAGAGVGALVTICTRLDNFPNVHAIAKSDPRIWCSAGVHPHQVSEEGVADTDAILALAGEARVVGIGETGLDYYYDYSPRDDQLANFRNHARAASESGLPLIVHTRDADEDTEAILREAASAGPLTGVLHCFSSGRALAEAALELGFYVSFSGIVTFRTAEALRDIARDVPLDRILVETDAPFLAPVPNRGKRNEPEFVVHTARCVAELKNMGEGEFAAATTDNFYRLFTRATRPEAA